MPDIASLIAYYVALLIFQYNQQPNAMATIELFISELMAEGIIFDVQQAYNLTGETAVGVQLDVLGKYAGVDRFYSELVLTNYFAMVTYAQRLALPTSPPAFGFSTYANFNNFSYNGTLQYDDLIAINNKLTDANFLTLIEFAIIRNSSNFSDGSIDNALFDFFGTEIRAEENGTMSMVFFISGALTPLAQAIVSKGLLPKPMAVGAVVVTNIDPDILTFAFADYTGYESPYGYGFSTYANYATVNGQDLTYSQIS